MTTDRLNCLSGVRLLPICLTIEWWLRPLVPERTRPPSEFLRTAHAPDCVCHPFRLRPSNRLKPNPVGTSVASGFGPRAGQSDQVPTAIAEAATMPPPVVIKNLRRLCGLGGVECKLTGRIAECSGVGSERIS